MAPQCGQVFATRTPGRPRHWVRANLARSANSDKMRSRCGSGQLVTTAEHPPEITRGTTCRPPVDRFRHRREIPQLAHHERDATGGHQRRPGEVVPVDARELLLVLAAGTSGPGDCRRPPGDHPVTARAIVWEIALEVGDDTVSTGACGERLSIAECAEAVWHNVVYARRRAQGPPSSSAIPFRSGYTCAMSRTSANAASAETTAVTPAATAAAASTASNAPRLGMLSKRCNPRRS